MPLHPFPPLLPLLRTRPPRRDGRLIAAGLFGLACLAGAAQANDAPKPCADPAHACPATATAHPSKTKTRAHPHAHRPHAHQRREDDPTLFTARSLSEPTHADTPVRHRKKAQP